MHPARDGFGGQAGKQHLSFAAMGNAHLDGQQVVLRDPPVDADRPIGAREPERRTPDASTRLRSDAEPPEAGLDHLQATDGAVHPIRDGTVSVVVERRHGAGMDAAVGEHRVPSFPDGRGAYPDGIEPGRRILLEEEPVRLRQAAGGDQGVEQEGGAEESGLDDESGFGDELPEAPAGSLTVRAGDEVEGDCQGVDGGAVTAD